MMLSIKKIGVIGSGMMGAEIALCFSRKGFPVVMTDVSLELAQKGKARIETLLHKELEKGKISSGEKETALMNIIPADGIGDMESCDFIVEAAKEDELIKIELFEKLDQICKSECIIASNTSSISVTKLASAVSDNRKGYFIGTHFNSPASKMKLVEVIPGMLTKEETVEAILDLLSGIEKEGVRVKDVVGFGLNRLFHAFVVEACRLVEEGVCSVEDVDRICIYGLGHPLGVFKLLDHTGHDLNLAVEKIMFDAYGDRFRPSPVLQRLVDSNRLGRKSGVGFYDYRK